MMKLQRKKKNGRITPQTRDDFVSWVKKKKALRKRLTEHLMDAKALAMWADDGGQ